MLRLKNGRIYDPVHGIDGQIRDLYIEDGRIVDEALVRALIDDEVTRMPRGLERLPEAVALFTGLCFAPTCESFLTLPAYEALKD